MNRAIYNWATKKKIGIDSNTAEALQTLHDFAAFGKQMPPDVEKRWREVGRFKWGRVRLTKEEIAGDDVAWILLALLYRGVVEWVPK